MLEDIQPTDRVSHPLLNEQLQAGIEGKFERAREIADYLEKLTPHCNRAAFNRGWYKIADDKLHEGLALLDRGRWESVFGSPPLKAGMPIYRKGEDLRGKKLLLRSEGGMGDEIVNARFASDFAALGANVTIACHPSLMSIFARIEGVSSVVSITAVEDIYHDCWVPAMSAARVLEYQHKNLSGKKYLSVHPHFKEKWQRYFAEKFSGGQRPKLGLRFFGNPKFEHEQYRLFKKQDLIDSVGDVPWVSLQKEETDLPIDTWEDTLAVIDQLELVITSCTSVAHASAALGKPTWVMVPVLPYYLWALPGSASPWYKNVRLFRQRSFGNWDEAFLELRSAFRQDYLRK